MRRQAKPWFFWCDCPLFYQSSREPSCCRAPCCMMPLCRIVGATEHTGAPVHGAHTSLTISILDYMFGFQRHLQLNARCRGFHRIKEVLQSTFADALVFAAAACCRLTPRVPTARRMTPTHSVLRGVLQTAGGRGVRRFPRSVLLQPYQRLATR